jgi:prophage DNA circulation protein
MRDWTKTLSGASFRGVPFQVEKATLPKSGRAVAVHRFVKSEEHATEDMGRLPREFRVTAYLASDAADAETMGLLEACSAIGPGLLALPFFEPGMVRCTSCGPSYEKTKLGFVGFDLEFIEAGQDGAGFPALPIGDRIAASALDTLSGLVSDALSGFAP